MHECGGWRFQDKLTDTVQKPAVSAQAVHLYIGKHLVHGHDWLFSVGQNTL